MKMARKSLATKTEEELPLNEALENAIKYIGDPKVELLNDFRRVFPYNDDPKYFQYSATLRHSRNYHQVSKGGGISFFSREKAALKCLSESLERFSLRNIDSHIIYQKPAKLNVKAIDIKKVASFTKTQRKNKNIPLDLDKKYGWVKGEELLTKKTVYIPAQLVYLSYKRLEDEPLIRFGISTGAAAGTSNSSAIYRGICELIERDAYMIYYLNKISPIELDFKNTKNSQIRHVVDASKNYNLDLRVFDITTDIKIPTFMALLIDETGISPALSVGLKSDLDSKNAILGSIEEAFHPKGWIRDEVYHYQGKKIRTPSNMAERGILWSDRKMLKHIDFFLRNTRGKKDYDEYKSLKLTSDEKLNKAAKEIYDKNMNIYFVNITPKKSTIKKSKFGVFMVVIPEMQPLYLDERYPYYGGRRLYEVPLIITGMKIKNEEELNKLPHPFL